MTKTTVKLKESKDSQDNNSNNDAYISIVNHTDMINDIFVEQPNGLYCLFSKKIKSPINWNMNGLDIMILCDRRNITALEATSIINNHLHPFDKVLKLYNDKYMTLSDFKAFLKEVGYKKEFNYKGIAGLYTAVKDFNCYKGHAKIMYNSETNRVWCDEFISCNDYIIYDSDAIHCIVKKVEYWESRDRTSLKQVKSRIKSKTYDLTVKKYR